MARRMGRGIGGKKGPQIEENRKTVLYTTIHSATNCYALTAFGKHACPK
jgi:hypothetical protein